MRRWLRHPTVYLLVLLTAAALGLGAWRARGPVVRTTTLERGDLEQHLIVSGRVRVPTRVQISTQAAGLVVAVTATEGRRVAAGDLLVQVDDAEARAAVAQAKANVAQARARVEQLKRVGSIVATEALKQAETNLQQADADLERTTSLVSSGALPSIELDNARRTRERALAQRAAAEAQQLSSQPVGADSRVALSGLLEAQARLAGAEARLSQTRIVAPEAGVVLQRDVEVGSVVQPGRGLMVLAADSRTELVFAADERNIPFIALGQHGRVAADSYPQQVFDAEVSFIAPAIDPQRGSIEVRLVVPAPPPFLKPDMTVSVDLSVARKQRVWILPSDAVHAGMTASPWVFVVEGGRVRRRGITLGLRGEGSSEVLSGLAPNADVVLPGAPPLGEGTRVRVQRGGS
jgi:HlyD family secretion protein